MTTEPTAELTITDVEFGTECPDIPERATGWERQQINALWRDVLHSSRTALFALRDVYNHPTAAANTGLYASREATKAAVAAEALLRTLNGVEHRIAMLDREEAKS